MAIPSILARLDKLESVKQIEVPTPSIPFVIDASIDNRLMTVENDLKTFIDLVKTQQDTISKLQELVKEQNTTIAKLDDLINNIVLHDLNDINTNTIPNIYSRVEELEKVHDDSV